MTNRQKWYPALILLVAGFLTMPVLADDDDGFLIRSAKWNESRRTLVVKIDSEGDDTLFTLIGLPLSTEIVISKWSDDDSFRFDISISVGDPVPCQVTVESGPDTKTAGVKKAPIGCNSMLSVASIVSGGG